MAWCPTFGQEHLATVMRRAPPGCGPVCMIPGGRAGGQAFRKTRYTLFRIMRQLAPRSLHEVLQVTVLPLMQDLHTSTHCLI
jgi:hypothetical protein